jgi:ketosteroid isomerase-like protein
MASLRGANGSHTVDGVNELPAEGTVRALVDAYNARDLDALLALFDEKAEWHTTPGFLWPGPYRGPKAIRGLFEHWWQGWASGHADIRELTVAGDRVMVNADIHGRSAGDGLDVHVPLTWVFHVRDGRVDLVRSFEDPAEARATLG